MNAIEEAAVRRAIALLKERGMLQVAKDENRTMIVNWVWEKNDDNALLGSVYVKGAYYDRVKKEMEGL